MFEFKLWTASESDPGYSLRHAELYSRCTSGNRRIVYLNMKKAPSSFSNSDFDSSWNQFRVRLRSTSDSNSSDSSNKWFKIQVKVCCHGSCVVSVVITSLMQIHLWLWPETWHVDTVQISETWHDMKKLDRKLNSEVTSFFQHFICTYFSCRALPLPCCPSIWSRLEVPWTEEASNSCTCWIWAAVSCGLESWVLSYWYCSECAGCHSYLDIWH